MEQFEEKWIKVYAMRLSCVGGDLGELNKEERKHLTLLMRKYELEQQSAELNTDMSQTTLPL